MIDRKCKCCGKTKPLNEFVKNKTCRHGRSHKCKECDNLRRSELMKNDTIICMCDECGDPVERPWKNFYQCQLKRGQSVVCVPCKHEFAAWGYLLNKMRRSSKYSQLETQLHPAITIKLLHDLWYIQEEKCWWTGVPLCLPQKHNGRSHGQRRAEPPSPFDASIDRIDSSIGYEPENIVISSTFANLGKSVYSAEQTVQYVAALRKVPNEN